MSLAVVVTGLSGRMGGRVAELVHGAPDLTLVGGTVRPGGAVPDGVGELPVSSDLAEVLAVTDAQVVIDFTLPALTEAHARTCAEAGVPLVCGTTGHSPHQREAVAAWADRLPLVLAPNMSVGVNLLFHLVRQAAAALGEGWDAEIAEIHHRLKRDAPSGTAVRLGEVLAAAQGAALADRAVHGRSGEPGPRVEGEIGFHALRGGDVVGEHTVFFFGAGERLELTHRAGDRDIFARGALQAARWLAGRAPGLYGMDAVLGL